MSLRSWLASLFVHPPAVSDPAHQALDAHEAETAERLSVLSGATRDDVLREAYRRADRIVGRKR